MVSDNRADFKHAVRVYVGAWFKAFEAFVIKKHGNAPMTKARAAEMPLNELWHSQKLIESMEIRWKGERFMLAPRSTAREDGVPVVSAAEAIILRAENLSEEAKLAIIRTKRAFPGALVESVGRDGSKSVLIPSILK
jgi:hypothetical protein